MKCLQISIVLCLKFSNIGFILLTTIMETQLARTDSTAAPLSAIVVVSNPSHATVPWRASQVD